MIIPSYPHVTPNEGALRKSDNLISVPYSLCHLEKSQGNRLFKEGFGSRAERERVVVEMAYTCNFWGKYFPVVHMNATEGSQA